MAKRGIKLPSNLIFYKTSTPKPAAHFISQRLAEELEKGKRVLWLVSGGSAIAVAVETIKLLDGVNLHNLQITLVDERFGLPGHKQSNWTRLEQSGFMAAKAKLHPVLIGKNYSETANSFKHFIESVFQKSAYKLALLGIGADGHTAGILPNTPAVDDRAMVSYYKTPQYKRITLTPLALSKLDEAVVYAIGRPKWKILDELEQNRPLVYQPAQILKRIPRVSIFNDYKGGKL